jgi:WD40 repeat protein
VDHAHGRTLRGHGDLVFSVCFSPDNRRLASASGDGTVRIWDVQTGDEVRRVAAHRYHVNCVAYSPDGRTLATASDDFTIALWNSTTGERKATLSGHWYCVQCVAFSPDGRLLASGTADGEIRAWDCETGQSIASAQGRDQRIRSIAIAPDGESLAVVDDGPGQVRVWSFPSLQPVFERNIEPPHTVQVIAYDPRTERPVTAFRYGGEVISLDSRTGEPTVLTISNSVRLDLEFSPDGEAMAIAGGGPSTLVLRGSSFLRAVYSSDSRKTSWCVAYSPDGRYLAAGSEQDILLWDLRNPPIYETLALYEHGAGAIACHPRVDHCAIATDRGMRVIDLVTRRELHSATAPGRVRTCTYSPDGQWLVTGGDQGIRIHDPDTLEERHVLNGFDSPVVDLAFSPDGGMLAACDGETARSWNTRTWEVAGAWGPSHIASVAVSFDDRVIIGENPVQTGIVYFVETNPTGVSSTDPPGVPNGPRSVQALTASDDGALLAACFEQGHVGLWDLTQFHATGERQLRDLSDDRHTHTVAAAAFSSDHTTLATADVSGLLTLWDVDSGIAMARFSVKTLADLPLGEDQFESLALAFTRDDSALIVAGTYDVTDTGNGNGFVFVLHAPHVNGPTR